MADITVTIQAASDSIMTENGFYGSTALADSDPRKAYGLPAQYITTEGYLKWARGHRWDLVNNESAHGKQQADGATTYLNPNYKSHAGSGYVKIPPTTTAFQLKCERINHDVVDLTNISPMMAQSVSDGVYAGSGTPGQLNNIVVSVGMRREQIKLSGMLVDRGPVSAANPRRQTLLNIARTQYLKIGRGGLYSNKSSSGEKHNVTWGGALASPLNPRAYPCLTIFDSLATPGYSIGREPSNDSRTYRGIIKQLGFTLDGGRPDHWQFNMVFEVVSNEHEHNISAGRPSWESRIERIRGVTSRDGGTSAQSGYSFLEVTTLRSLQLKRPGIDGIPDEWIEMIGYEDSTVRPTSDKLTATTAKQLVGQGTIVYIEGSNSAPTINGHWFVRHVNLDNDTFILAKPASVDYGLGALWANSYNYSNQATLTASSDTCFQWQTDQITQVGGGGEEDAASGHVFWGPNKAPFGL